MIGNDVSVISCPKIERIIIRRFIMRDGRVIRICFFHDLRIVLPPIPVLRINPVHLIIGDIDNGKYDICIHWYMCLYLQIFDGILPGIN